MVEVVQLTETTAMVVQAAMHFKRLLNPRQVHPLKLLVALAKHRGKAGAQIGVGAAHEVNALSIPF